MRHFPSLCLVPVLIALTGCAMNNLSEPTNIANSGMQGSVFGGQQPVTASTVTVYAVGTSGYGAGATALATTTTDQNGNFNFAAGSYTCPFSNTPLYITAKGGNSGFGTAASSNTAIMLAAGIGPCSSASSVFVNLNEVTTAATALALSHFFTTTLGTTSTDAFGGTAAGNGVYNAGLVIANTNTIPTIVSLASGGAITSTTSITREPRKLNTLANILAACVNSTGGAAGDQSVCGKLFTATTPPVTGATAPTDTLQAAVQIALYPYQNVATLYSLPPAASPFVGLSNQPNDFTIAVGYTASTLGLGITAGLPSGKSSNIDIDATGRVWFPTNTTTSHGVAYFDPTTNTFSGPYATVLQHPQYVAIDNVGNVFATDNGSPMVASVSTTTPTGTVTTFGLPAGTVVGPIGATSNGGGDAGGVSNAMIYNATSSAGGSNLYVINVNTGSQAQSVSLSNPASGLAPFNYNNPDTYYEAEVATSNASSPCNLEAPYTDQGTNYPTVIATTSDNPCYTGGIAQLNEVGNESAAVASTAGKLCSYLAKSCFVPPVPVSTPEGIAIDGDSNVWLANAGNSSVSTLHYLPGTRSSADYVQTSNVVYLHDSTHGNTMTTPYGIAIDRSGNVWVSNVGCVSGSTTACTPNSFVLSELIGAAAPTVTPLVTANSASNHVVRP